MNEQENVEVQTEATAEVKVEKVNKMELAAAVYAQVHAADPKIEKPRKEFMKIMTEQHGMSVKGAASYYQMQSYEAQGKGKYKHHNKKKAKAAEPIVAATEPTITTEGSAEAVA